VMALSVAIHREPRIYLFDTVSIPYCTIDVLSIVRFDPHGAVKVQKETGCGVKRRLQPALDLQPAQFPAI